MSNESTSWVGRRLKGDRYHITGHLGQGGMGFVYRAHDEDLDTEVVVKVPHARMIELPGVKQRFAREIHSLVKLSHPHIVKVIDVGEHESLPFVVMQFLGGGSVADRRPTNDEGQPLPTPLSDIRRWFEPIAGALDFIHRKGFVHRDVKPANIIFDTEGHAYLSDFGIAKVLSGIDRDPATLQLTQTGMMIGTPQFMAPELLSDGLVDGRADQYALAVAVFDLLACRYPINGQSLTSIIAAHLTSPPLVLADVRPDLPMQTSTAIARALSKNATDRFADCLSFIRALTVDPAIDPVAQPSGAMLVDMTETGTKVGGSCSSGPPFSAVGIASNQVAITSPVDAQRSIHSPKTTPLRADTDPKLSAETQSLPPRDGSASTSASPRPIIRDSRSRLRPVVVGVGTVAVISAFVFAMRSDSQVDKPLVEVESNGHRPPTTPVIEDKRDRAPATVALDATRIRLSSNPALNQANQLLVDGKYEDAIAALTNVVKLSDDKNELRLALKLRSSAYVSANASENIARALADSQASGSKYLPVTVRRDNAKLMVGTEIVAMLKAGQVLEVGEVQGDFVSVISVNGDKTVTGWLNKSNLAEQSTSDTGSSSVSPSGDAPNLRPAR